jgi:hypothetical protein
VLNLPAHVKQRLRLAPPRDPVRIAVECAMSETSNRRQARYRNDARDWRARYVYRADRIGSGRHAEDCRRWREKEKAYHEELFGHLVGRERLPMAPAR